MRAKMRAHLDKPKPGRWDVKQGAGGLIDVEFLVQYRVLAAAAEHPEVVRWPDVWRQLDALVEAGRMPRETAADLLEAQRSYRAHLHRRLLQGASADAGAEEFGSLRERVLADWAATL